MTERDAANALLREILVAAYADDHAGWMAALDEASAHLGAKPADPAVNADAIREAALREAAKALRDWQDSLNAHRSPDTAIAVGMSADVVLALIPKGAADDRYISRRD